MGAGLDRGRVLSPFVRAQRNFSSINRAERRAEEAPCGETGDAGTVCDRGRGKAASLLSEGRLPAQEEPFLKLFCFPLSGLVLGGLGPACLWRPGSTWEAAEKPGDSPKWRPFHSPRRPSSALPRECQAGSLHLGMFGHEIQNSGSKELLPRGFQEQMVLFPIAFGFEGALRCCCY